MTYSKLTNKYVPVTNHWNARSGNKVVRLTPHYMAGNLGAEACALYHRNVEASANYYIGSDGQIVCGVPEEYRAWTSSSWDNDSKAITFECANIDGNGTLTDACYASLVKLCADICKRYGINPSRAGGTITMHKDFAPTACPGPWLTNKITSGQFEKDIKAQMDGKAPAVQTPAPTPTSQKWVQDTVLKVGDTVKSVSCGITGVKEPLVNVPALGGWIPLADVDESADTKDGKCDNYLATINARVFYLPKKVIAIDAVRNLCKCEGCDYWIKCEPLMALR